MQAVKTRRDSLSCQYEPLEVIVNHLASGFQLQPRSTRSARRAKRIDSRDRSLAGRTFEGCGAKNFVPSVFRADRSINLVIIRVGLNFEWYVNRNRYRVARRGAKLLARGTFRQGRRNRDTPCRERRRSLDQTIGMSKSVPARSHGRPGLGVEPIRPAKSAEIGINSSLSISFVIYSFL